MSDPMAGTDELQQATVVFRRPTKKDAITLASNHFLAGERVEMGALAAELGISRTTLYRRVGERDQLLGEVIASAVDYWAQTVERDAEGTGVDRFLDAFGRYLKLTAAFDPLTELTQREPQLALRLLNDPQGPVIIRSRENASRVLAESVPDLDVPPSVIEAIVTTAVANVWTQIAIGREPDVDRALYATRLLLLACEHGLAR